MNGDDTRTDLGSASPDPAAGASGATSWVGRAKPPQPVDPYWPPVETDYPHTYPVVIQERRPRRSGRTTALIVGGVLAACLAGGATLALFGGALVKGVTQWGADEPGTDQRTTPPGGPDKKKGGGDSRPEEPAPAGLNTPVRDGKLEFVVTSVSCGHDSIGGPLVNKRPKGQFCVVTLTVTNIGTDSQAFTEFVQQALGPDGTEYSVDTVAGVIANQGAAAVWSVIEPGDTVTGTLVYDIPAEEDIATLELHDSPLSNGVTVTL